uniref:Helicase superfamily 3 single-stranded DNA/RNA virus domain-containing protein n=1 Tax=Uncultured marine euryarchaeote TaxID=257466 RepID=A0A1B0Z1W4_UNCAR|nr:hypothetical protein [uncultured marine euryarchaeote]
MSKKKGRNKSSKATKKKVAQKATEEPDAPKDNPSKNFAITGYLTAFPKSLKESQGIEPELQDFLTAFHEMNTPEMIELLSINCMVAEVEIGEGQTKHLQAYCQTIKRMRRSTFNNLIRKHTGFNFSIQNARGSAAQNIAYVTKGTGTWEYSDGTTKYSETITKRTLWINEKGLVKTGGQRSDMKSLARFIENGATTRELDERFPSQMLRYGHGVEKLRFRKKMAESKVERDVKLVVLYGDKGTGKSTDARHKITEQYGFTSDDVYSLQFGKNSRIWFDGYIGEKVLLLDDYEPDLIDRSTLLKLTDIYQFIGQIKGGHIVAEWELVILTTNSDIADICTVSEAIESNGSYRYGSYPDPAFMSRIAEGVCYDGMPDLRQRKNPIKITRLSENQTLIPDPEATTGEPAGEPKSVASLLPDTLTHGTKKCDGAMQVQDAILPEPPSDSGTITSEEE